MIPSQSASSPVIGSDDLKILGDKLLPIIEQAAADGTLGNAPYYYDILRAWRYLGGTAEAKAWLASGMEASADFLATATKSLTSYTTSSDGSRFYEVHARPDEALYDLSLLLAACQKHLAGDVLNGDQRKRASAVAKAVEIMLQADAEAAAQGGAASNDDPAADSGPKG